MDPIERALFDGYAYINNTDQVEMEEYEGEDLNKIIKRMQQAIDFWKKSINYRRSNSSGKVPLVLIRLKWKVSTWYLSTINDVPNTLTVKDTNRERKKILYKE